MKRTITDSSASQDEGPPPESRRRRDQLPVISEDVLVNQICSYLDFVCNFKCRAVSKVVRNLVDKKLAERYPRLSVQLNVHFWDNFSLEPDPPRHDQILVHCKETENAILFESIQGARDSADDYDSLCFPVNRRLPNIRALKPTTLSLRAWSVPRNARGRNLPPRRGFVGADLVKTLGEQAGVYVESLYIANLTSHPRGLGPSLQEMFSQYRNLTKLRLHTYIYLPTLINGIIQVKTLRALQLHVYCRNLSSSYQAAVPFNRCMDELNRLPELRCLEIVPHHTHSREHFQMLVPRVARLRKLDICGLGYHRVPELLAIFPHLEELGSLQIITSPVSVGAQTVMRDESRRGPLHEQLRTIRIQVYDEDMRKDGFLVSMILAFCNRSLRKLENLEIHFETTPDSRRAASSLSSWIRQSLNEKNLRGLSNHPTLGTLKIAVAKSSLNSLERTRLDDDILPNLIDQLNERVSKHIMEVPFLMENLVGAEAAWWLPLPDGRKDMSHLSWHRERQQQQDQMFWAIPRVDEDDIGSGTGRNRSAPPYSSL